MTGDNSSLNDEQRKLDEVVAAYLQAQEAGAAPAPDEWLARYPDLASELAEFFDAQKGIADWARPPALAETETWQPATAHDQRRAPSGRDPSSLQSPPAHRQSAGTGDLIANRYRVFDIKAGGMGLVYLADDLDALDCGVELKVAVKTVQNLDAWRQSRRAKRSPADYSQYTSLLARFHREALAWVRLGVHNNIIFARCVEEIGNKPHLIMEYADSGDLSAWIKQRRLSVPLAVNFALQFCEGMKHAVRASGMVHRDIKPSNVLIKDNRIVKIADFGLSKVYDAAAENGSPLGGRQGTDLHSSAAAGTLAYMPPEQFEGLDRADTRSDIFSFGVMLHEMLTGQRLFAERNAYDLSCRNSPLPHVHSINAAAPPALSAIVQQCLQYDPRSATRRSTSWPKS